MVDTAGNTASVVSVVLQVGKWFARPIGRQFMYLYNYGNNLDKLEIEVQKLKVAKEEVKNKVVAAEKNVEKIKQNVMQWQNEVNSIIDEAEQLIAEKANDRCFKGFCPNLITRYKHGKKAFEIDEDNISPLLQQLQDFDRISYPTVLEDMWLKPDKNYDLFTSRDSTFKNILKALNDANVNVGVYGMGGIGKTTLVKEIGRQAKKDKIFDVVVLVEVNKTLDIEKIQKEIGRNLGVKFEEETQRASKLYERLKKKEEKILIILDNLWDEFDLKSVGIPDEVDDRGCKLLLTARERPILLKMGCPNPLQIDSLNAEESWRLFKTTTGDFIETQEFKSLAENVCKKCGGLPIAIVTVAKALQYQRHSSQWKEALRQLRRCSSKNFTTDMKEAYASIELSYKYLKGEELQKTFLLCSLMKHQAFSSDLVKYVIGLDIFQGIYTIEETRDKVNALICHLKDSCLLLNGHTYDSFSMHDFVREVALSIANRDDYVFSMRNEIKWGWPHQDNLKIYKKIFVHDSTIGDLSKGFLDCPQLESFFMNTKVGDSHVEIPDNFFIRMKKLKIIDLTRMQFSSLSSLSLLVNLQTLCLDYSKFEHVTIIGELKKLKILSLRGSSIEQLPKEIGQLTQLKLLDLSHCEQLEVIAPNVLSNLVGLEELYMNGCSVLWEVGGLNVQRSNASLEELKHLFHLTTLEIDIKDDEIVPEGLFTKKLDRYKISIGVGSSMFGGSYLSSDRKYMHIRSFSFDKPNTSIRTLKLKLNSTIWSDKLQGFKNVEFLCLDKLQGISNVAFDLDHEGFSQLKHLRVHNNPNVLYIVDSIKCTPHDAFLTLESLILFNLINLEKICYGQPTVDSFSNLKIIEVAHCVKLENIFSSSNSSSLPQLQTIHVRDCENMKEIFFVEKEDNVNNNNEVIARIEFCQLRDLILLNLPRIASFYSEVKTPSPLPVRRKESTTNLQSNDMNLEDGLDNFTPLVNGKVVFPNLKTLELQAINSEMIWDNQLPTMSSCYQSLTHLIISSMYKLKYVFPSTMVKNLEQLQYLKIRNCKELKEIVAKEEGAEAAATFIFSGVEFLYLNNLPKLTTFYHGIHTSNWPKLKNLEVSDCENLHIFTSEYKVVFPNLEDVRLEAINSQMIWDSQLPVMSYCYQKLTSLVIKDIEKLKYVFPSSMVKNFKQLQNFEISSCKDLKEIVAKEGAEVPPTFIFPRVEFLKLKNLSKLKTFYPGIHVSEWPILKKLEVSSCDELQMSTSEYKVVLPNLEALELHGTNTENIWHSQLLKTSSCFRKLTRLILGKCEKLKYVFLSSMVKSFEQLQHLEINTCKELKEIVTKDQGEETIAKFDFPRVNFLKLNDLPELTTFCLGIPTLEWPWPNLKKLELSDCDKLQMLTSENQIKPRLEELVLRADNMMTWQCLLPENFSCKCTVKINGDKSINSPFSIFKRPFHLEKLILRDSSYKEIFSYGCDDRHTGTLMQIKCLELRNLSNLKNMWRKDSKPNSIIQNVEILEVRECLKLSCLLPASSTSFANLTVLSVSVCWGLIKLFTPSTAKSMVQLREIEIGFCLLLTEAVSNEEDVGVEDGIVFGKLKLLSLNYLESLTSFYYGNFTFEFPALEELIVRGCPNMKTFSEGVISAPYLQKVKKHKMDKEGCWEGDLNTTIQQLYIKEVNSNLEELTLSGKDIMSAWQDQFPRHQFSKVKVVNVIQDESTTIPIEILQRFNNLEILILTRNSYQELFSWGEGEKHVGMLIHMKELQLFGLFDLKHMWKQDSHMDSVLQNLEQLRVYSCHNLINIAPSSASFDNLIALYVWNCDGLVNLVTSSTAKSMVQLECLSIEDCETTVEIVANTGGVEKDEVVFSKLKSLSLVNLESLRSFCSGNHTFKFQALEDMTVGKCPKMNTFSRGVLSTPKLDKVKQKQTQFVYEGHWEGDLNTTIQHLFKKAVGQKLPGSSSKST